MAWASTYSDAEQEEANFRALIMICIGKLEYEGQNNRLCGKPVNLRKLLVRCIVMHRNEYLQIPCQRLGSLSVHYVNT